MDIDQQDCVYVGKFGGGKGRGYKGQGGERVKQVLRGGVLR